jgi:putative FmdB family regulatory protein
MPIYAYRCNKCSEKFESFRGIYASDEDVICPNCGERKPQRVISAICGSRPDPNRGNLRFPT